MKNNTNTQLQANEGLGMPAPTRKHQFLIGKIHKNFIKKFPRRSNHILMGVDVLDNPNHERIPDISIWNAPFDADDETIGNLILTIEITHSTQNDNYSEASIIESFKLISSLQESFIYNYQTDNWTRYRRTDKGLEKSIGKDYSQILNSYLHTLLC